MIRIAISQAAFDAIARTMPFGSVNFEAGVDDKGERLIWLPRAERARPHALAARAGRELQRRHSAARGQRRAALRSKPGREMRR
jgi:hypothetical protein